MSSDQLASGSSAQPNPAGKPVGVLNSASSDSHLSGGVQPSLPPAAEPMDDRAEAMPTRIGDYELLRELGRGGMGVVYLARQASLNRLVALKTILAIDHGNYLARFKLEAEAAANLRHPGIVSIYEVGCDRGRHFYSMELVEGQDLLDLIRERTLTGEEAARYVAAVADAMQYAHDHGILHRDLKPSNVLIDSAGHVKVTDFGLAKRVDDQSDLTGDAIVGTPSYLPPEQAVASWGPVGPHSDVYSLGAVLYQLLTSRPPFRAETPLETIRQMLSSDPVAPRLLNAQIPRDMETLCLKCLEKEIPRRYRSARELADELQRFLRGDPIQARPLNRFQRLGRWCRRHPSEAALIALVLLVLLVGSVGITWQWTRAERNLVKANRAFERLNSASDEMLKVVEDWVVRLPLDSRDEQQAIDSTLARYEQFLGDEPSNIAARIKVAETHHHVAGIRRSLRQFDLAISHFQAAVAEYERVQHEQPFDPEIRRKIADEQDWLGETLREAGHLDDALRTLNIAVAAQESLAQASPDRLLNSELARSLYNRALTARDLGRLPQAMEDGRRAIELLASWSEPGTPLTHVHEDLARCHINLGIMLRESGQSAAALTEYDRATELLRALIADVPAKVKLRELRSELAQAQQNRGNLLLTFRAADSADAATTLDESAGAFREAIQWLQALVAEYPSVLEYRNQLANAWNGLGSNAQIARQNDAALAAFEQAGSHFLSLVERSPESADFHSRLAITLANRATLTAADDPDADRVALLRRAIEHQTNAIRLAPKAASYASLLRRHRTSLARTLLQQGEHALAVAEVQQIGALAGEDWKEWRLAATLLAKAIEIAQSDSGLDAQRRQSLQRHYGRQACDYLDRAITFGPPEARNLDAGDTFRALASLPEFQSLRSRAARP